MNINHILFREKKVKALLLLADTEFPKKTASEIGFALKATYADISKFFKLMEVEGIVYRERNGRMKELSLTKKGYIIAQHLKEMKDKLAIENAKEPEVGG